MPQIFPQSFLLMYILFVISIFILFVMVYPEKQLIFLKKEEKKLVMFNNKFLFKW